MHAEPLPFDLLTVRALLLQNITVASGDGSRVLHPNIRRTMTIIQLSLAEER